MWPTDFTDFRILSPFSRANPIVTTFKPPCAASYRATKYSDEPSQAGARGLGAGIQVVPVTRPSLATSHRSEESVSFCVGARDGR
mmetsp:Transcript_20049/g.60955  ORF Transcript_20049/g.60955 Transcript_20049/m.60955 type:complete len:85 (-) Transcript_20049:4163-4417(-)